MHARISSLYNYAHTSHARISSPFCHDTVERRSSLEALFTNIPKTNYKWFQKNTSINEKIFLMSCSNYSAQTLTLTVNGQSLIGSSLVPLSHSAVNLFQRREQDDHRTDTKTEAGEPNIQCQQEVRSDDTRSWKEDSLHEI